MITKFIYIASRFLQHNVKVEDIYLKYSNEKKTFQMKYSSMSNAKLASKDLVCHLPFTSVG